MKEITNYIYRILARIVLQAKTPLSVGCGEKNTITDSLVVKDINGLPYIPGTSISGVLRSMIGAENSSEIFGFQSMNKGDSGKGSKIIFSDAKMIGADGVVIDGIKDIDYNDEFYSRFVELPIRQHTRINGRGVTLDGGKFDEQIVYKGARFCFEIEMVASEDVLNNFNDVLSKIYCNTFRLGSGSRSGFGEMSVEECKTAKLCLKDETHLNAYLDKKSDLSDQSFWNSDFVKEFKNDNKDDNWTRYVLSIVPQDFFMFGSGFGNDNADMTAVTESMIEWEDGKDGKPYFKDNNILMPATSIKGAISHRVAFHWNKLNGMFAGENSEAKVGSDNPAVKSLFGSVDDKNGKDTTRGNVIISDVIESPKGSLKTKTKILNHVAIDRFTGGAIAGALFSEEPIYGDSQPFELSFLVNKTAFEDPKTKEAFELALNDICCGLLPLGGGVNRGNGIFMGEIISKED